MVSYLNQSIHVYDLAGCMENNYPTKYDGYSYCCKSYFIKSSWTSDGKYILSGSSNGMGYLWKDHSSSTLSKFDYDDVNDNSKKSVIKPSFIFPICDSENDDVTNFPIYLRAKKYKIGYVPQYGGYFHDLTLIDNLKAVGEILIENKIDRMKKINNLIAKFELDNIQEIKAKYLSGGQRRKLVICMALLADPKILLCDEIFAALDILTIQMLKEILVTLQKS